MNRVFQSVLLVTGGVAFFVVAALVPSHWKVIAPEVLAKAGEGTESVATRVEFLLQSEKPGMASLLAGTPGLALTNAATVSPAIADLIGKRPMLRLSGGAEPIFEKLFSNSYTEEQFEESFGGVMSADGIITNSASLFLNSGLRLRLQQSLEESGNAIVRSLLRTREIRHFSRLHPIDHPTGAALDVSAMMTALLVQSGALHQDTARTLQLWAETAVAGPNRESEKIEIYYLCLLNLASRMGYGPLAELTRHFDSARSIVNASAVSTSGEPMDFHVYYAASILIEDPDAVFRFLDQSADRKQAVASLVKALNAGAGAVRFLTGSEHKHVASRSPLVSLGATPVASLADNLGLVPMAARLPGLALFLRIFLFGLAGLMLTVLVFRIAGWSAAEQDRRFPALAGTPAPWLFLSRNLVVALLLAGFFWVVTEPPAEATENSVKARDTGASISPSPVQFIFSTSSMNNQTLDQPTLIVLFVFLVVQFALYLICRLKLSEIRRADVDPALKLELLANEENLFDSGLYVGLGGTVLALSMVTLGMVEASLMAAYASTLFGILFVAILKIFHLRPVRRKLLLESREKQ